MNCKDANKKISLMIDGMLNEKAEHLLMEHINDCSECKKLYNDMKAMVLTLSDLPEIPLPDGMENRIHFALKREAEKPKKKKWIRYSMIAMPVTVAAFAIILGISYFSNGGIFKSFTAEKMDIAFESAEEPLMQKAAPAMEEKAMEAGSYAKDETDAVTEESREAENAVEEAETLMMDSEESQPMEFTVSIKVLAESYEETEMFAQSILNVIYEENAYEMILDGREGTVKVYLPIVKYDELITLINSVDTAEIKSDTRAKEAIYDDSQMFEVIFLFQNN